LVTLPKIVLGLEGIGNLWLILQRVLPAFAISSYFRALLILTDPLPEIMDYPLEQLAEGIG
jgi:hypothetical protein